MTAKKDWRAALDPTANAMGWAGAIERNVPPREWPQALACVPEPFRAEVETYLRAQAQRMRVIRTMKNRGMPCGAR